MLSQLVIQIVTEPFLSWWQLGCTFTPKVEKSSKPNQYLLQTTTANTRHRSRPPLTVALSRTLMEPGSATLCFLRACSNSWRGGRSHFPKTTKSMSLNKRKMAVNYCSPHHAVTDIWGSLVHMTCTPISLKAVHSRITNIPLRESKCSLWSSIWNIKTENKKADRISQHHKVIRDWNKVSVPLRFLGPYSVLSTLGHSFWPRTPWNYSVPHWPCQRQSQTLRLQPL